MANNQTQAVQRAPQQSVAQAREAADFLKSDSVKQAIEQIAAKIPPERLARVAITAVMSKPELIQATTLQAGKASLLQALMRCAQTGLEPDGREAHLVPYWSSEHRCYLVQFQADYKGLLRLAKENGVDAKGILVCANDEFLYIEDNGEGKTVVTHRYDPLADRGAVVGVYSRALENGKDPDYEFMSIDEVNSIRSRSKAKDKGPWVTDTNEMIKKTVLRRHSKRWPLKPEVREAFTSDDDTPETLQAAPTTTKPIFNAPKKPQEPSESAGDTSSTPSEPEAPQADPGGNEPVFEEALPTPIAPDTANPVRQLRGLCRTDKVKESVLLGMLAELGSCDPGLQSLEELALKNPSMPSTVISQWPDILKKIKSVTK
jgi:recombination protein RecT